MECQPPTNHLYHVSIASHQVTDPESPLPLLVKTPTLKGQNATGTGHQSPIGLRNTLEMSPTGEAREPHHGVIQHETLTAKNAD